MCLDIKKTSKRQTAKKDITVYKNVRIELRAGVAVSANIMNCDVSWLEAHSYYQKYTYTFGKTYKSRVIKKSIRILGRGIKKRYSVEIGFHSFKNKYDALRTRQFGTQVVKCTIPKGAQYYTGVWQMHVSRFPNYASTKIILNNVEKNVSYNKGEIKAQ